jgi:hypothetical protein
LGVKIRAENSLYKNVVAKSKEVKLGFKLVESSKSKEYYDCFTNNEDKSRKPNNKPLILQISLTIQGTNSCEMV